MSKIDKKYLVPLKNISCPGCGLRYGHHKTKVDKITEECSTCCKRMKYKKTDLIDADEFITTILEILPA